MNYAFLIASILGLTGVLLGAYGDHSLPAHLAPADLESWHVALHYHQIYAVIILVLAAFEWLPNSNRLGGLGWLVGLFTLGVVLFSGSIYLRVLTGYSELIWVTPLGGTLLIASWIGTVLAAIMWRK